MKPIRAKAHPANAQKGNSLSQAFAHECGEGEGLGEGSLQHVTIGPIAESVVPRGKASSATQRRALRKQSTSAETLLWNRLRNRQLLDCKFRRQHSFGPYVVDFCSKELKLVIELDGDSHFIGNAHAADRKRQSFIERYGVEFLRFTNMDVFDNMDGVIQDISEKILALRDGRGRGV